MYDSPTKIAVFLPNWVGDVVMATPTIRALRERFPRPAKLVGILRPYVADVLDGTDWLDESLIYGTNAPGVYPFWSLIAELRRRQFDLAVLLTNSFKTAAIARLGGAKRRIGYARDGRSWLLTDRLQPLRNDRGYEPVSAVDYYLALAERLGCSVSSNKRLEVAVTPKDDALADEVWNATGLPRDRRVVAMHLAGGWGGTASAKAWPADSFAQLAERIVRDTDWSVLVLCGPNEKEIAKSVVGGAKSPRLASLADFEPSLGLTKACLQRSSFLVSTDSGPRHLGTALDLPVIGLFGATDPRWSETYHARATTIFNKLDCGPCAKKHCPLGTHACMREITVDLVWNHVLRHIRERDALLLRGAA